MKSAFSGLCGGNHEIGSTGEGGTAGIVCVVVLVVVDGLGIMVLRHFCNRLLPGLSLIVLSCVLIQNDRNFASLTALFLLRNCFVLLN